MDQNVEPKETTQPAVLRNKLGDQIDSTQVTHEGEAPLLVKFGTVIGIYAGAQDGTLFYNE